MVDWVRLTAILVGTEVTFFTDDFRLEKPVPYFGYICEPFSLEYDTYCCKKLAKGHEPKLNLDDWHEADLDRDKEPWEWSHEYPTSSTTPSTQAMVTLDNILSARMAYQKQDKEELVVLSAELARVKAELVALKGGTVVSEGEPANEEKEEEEDDSDGYVFPSISYFE